MHIRRSSKQKDPIGAAVFYPNSLPPPPRRSSQATTATAPRPSSPIFAPAPQFSPPIPTRTTSLAQPGPSVPAPPYEYATEYPFPRQTPPQRTPSSQLTTMLEDWNLFTPSPDSCVSSPPGHFAPDSAPDLSLLSPDALPLGDLIDDALIQDESSPYHPPRIITTPHKSSVVLDSPAPRTGRFGINLSDRGAGRGPGRFYLGSPEDLHLSPSTRPIPFRQPSWGGTPGARRASVPNVSVRIEDSYSSSSYYPPSPLAHNPPLLPLPTALPPSVVFPPLLEGEDIFSPAYSLGPSLSSPNNGYTFPPQSSQTSLHFQSREPAPLPVDLPHQPQPIYRSLTRNAFNSEIAAHHLQSWPLNGDFIRRYELGDELGAGGFGFVCSAYQTGFENALGVEVAVKFIFKDRLHEADYGFICDEPVESYVLKRCRHPNIIAFLALFEDSRFFYLIQELHGDPWSPGHTLEQETHIFAPSSVPPIPVLDVGPSAVSPGSSIFSSSPSSGTGGWRYPSPRTLRPNMARRASHDLFEAVEHRRFTEDQGRTIFRQIVAAVSYLHKRGVYHRDLKDENIVIDRNLQVKIIDFGAAVFEDRLQPPVIHTNFRGTMSYASSEVLRGQSYHAGPVDIFALGIILGIVLTGESPFPSPLHAQSGRIKMKRRISTDAYDLLARCVHEDPASRATVEMIEAHRWLKFPFAQRGSV